MPVTAEYAEPDWDVVDYHVYCLDPDVRDRQTGAALLLRGPAPRTLEAGRYFVCIGAAQTFGRFCEKPFPTLLQERLGLESVNLGRGGAGPSFFSQENGRLLEYVNSARFAIIQVMAGRSASNSLFESKGLGYYIRRSDGTGIGCDQAFTELLASRDVAHIKQVVAETRQDWLASNTALLQAIHVPKILLWLSERRPEYREGYTDLNALFGRFPQLVNADMIRQLTHYSDDYVECVSTKGLPQVLINRFTGRPTSVRDPWGGTWNKNWYYPSPAMHVDAAHALERVARRYTEPGGPHRRLMSFWVAGKDLLARRLRERH